MKRRCFLFLATILSLTEMSIAQTPPTPEACLKRLTAQLDALLSKDQPPLFAWHLRSIRALAETEFAKFQLPAAQNQHPKADREKEYVQYVTAISQGFEGENADPDAYIKNGRRTLILARPSNLDGSLQYMMVGLPKNWDPNRAYAMFVGLHGTGPDFPLAYPSFGFGPSDPPKADAPPNPTADMISLAPWGRGNRGWRGDAETDLFEAIQVLKTFAKLDPDRWYLTGHSAGADGTWAIIQHTPDLWAAAGLQSGSMLSGEPEWGLIPNMTYLPVHILIGEKDPLPNRIPDSKRAFEILTKAGDQTKLVILPGIGHYPLTDEGLREQADWMTRFVRKRPSKFEFTMDQGIHPGVWGISVPGSRRSIFTKEPWPHFTCEVNGQEVRIKTRYIKELRVDLGDNGLKMSGHVRLTINGKLVFEGEATDLAQTIKI